MAGNNNTRQLQPRTARTPSQEEQKYVIAEGAPVHYVDGYGLVRAGAIVSLAPGVTPGKWYVEVSPEDAAKASASEQGAIQLAVLAGAKIRARGNNSDVARKEAADEVTLANAIAREQQRAQSEADAIEKAANADKQAAEAKDAEQRERDRADEAEKRAKQAEADLAKLQAQVAQSTGKTGPGGKPAT